MLDEDSLCLYRDAHLTHDMRNDILNLHKRRQTTRRTIACICAALVIGTVVFRAANIQSGLYIDNQKLTARIHALETESVEYMYPEAQEKSIMPTVASMSIYQTADCCFAFTAKYGKDVCITVDAGMLLVPGENETILASGPSAMVSNRTTFYWSADGIDTLSPVHAYITDLSGDDLDTLTFAYRASDGAWLVSANS